MKYNVIDTHDQVLEVLNYPTWTAYARTPGREDCSIYDETGVRKTPKGLQVNFGEYNPTMGKYINEEWLTPQMVYIKHRCDGCHYPPSMCCLQPEHFRDGDERDRYGYLVEWALTDEEILESRTYQSAEQALWENPPITTRIEEGS